MGCFSWILQDTHERIINGRPMHVVMCDDKGNKYVEECYEGYGVFGGKDFYEQVAEMNGYKVTEYHGTWHVKDKDGKDHFFETEEQAKDKLRSVGIDLAFDGHPHGDNPAIKYPSLTTRGWYCNGECPESDPDQGFSMEEMYDEYHDEEWEEDRWV